MGIGCASGVGGRLGLAVSTQPEQLETVRVDAIAAAPGDLGHGLGHPCVFDLCGPSTARTDDVVVMGRRAGHVRMLAARQIHALDDPEIGEKVQRPEQGGPADADPAISRGRLELQRGEVPAMFGDESGDLTPRAGEAIAREVQGVDDVILIGHDRPWY